MTDHYPPLHPDEQEPIALNPLLRGVDLAVDRLIRRDCFTERTLAILDELREELVKVSRPLPTREQIAREMEQILIESVGECTCDEAYTTRSLNDPDCLWHNVNPHGEFPGDAADAVLALLKGE